MHDVESHTVGYSRDVLVTRAHRDPGATSFLTMWNYEEYWLGGPPAMRWPPTTRPSDRFGSAHPAMTFRRATAGARSGSDWRPP